MSDRPSQSTSDAQPSAPPPTPPAPAPHPFQPAGKHTGPWIVLLATIALGLLIDLGSKWIAFERVAGIAVEVHKADVEAVGPQALQTLIPPHAPVVVIPHVLDFHLVLNSGAVFGAGQGLRWFFILFTLAALVFAAGFFARWSDRRDHVTHIAIGLIISGGLGNLYDRIRFACVRDFLHPLPTARLPFGLKWPGGDSALWPYVSNVADAFLIIGIGLLLIRLWRAPAPAAPPAPTSHATPAPDA